MWSFDDKKRDFLPVREGTDQGGGQERVMLNAVGGANGIRRREEDNFDGTTTTLYTRNGRPVFETTESVRGGSGRVRRGFLVKDPQSGYAVLFNPYTLEVEQKKYVPALNTYSVQDFNTRWNVLSSDTTHWDDVVMFDGTLVKVNARHMSSLMTKADHGFQAIPFVIDTNDDENRYGSRELNTAKKRVFAVGRDQVKSWGGGGVTETLTPLTPRAEGRAMTIGQRIDVATNKAFFGQLFHTAMAWDDIGGGWGFSAAEVSMLLTPPYLSKVSSSSTVELTASTFGTPASSSGSMTTSTTLPPTAIGMSATPSVGHYANYPTVVHGIVYFYWSDIVVKPMDGTIHANYSRMSYSIGSVSETEGLRTYTASNVKNYDSRSEYPTVAPQFIPFTDTTPTATDMRLNAASDHLFWSLVDNGLTIDLGPMRGEYGYSCEGEDVGSRPIVSRDYETQNGSFVVSFSGVETVRVTMFREYSTGEQWVATPNLNFYDSYMGRGDEYLGDEFGIGLYSWPFVRPYYDGNVNPVSQYKLVDGVQSPEVCAEITNALNSMVNALMGQTVYQSENAEGYYSRPAPWVQGHYFSSTTTEDKTTASLTWDTKDFILYDATNGVFISIEGSFAGSGHPATATLSVSLKVQTRYHTNVITLGEWSYTYSDLLPEKIFDEANGLWAVPSPQIRAIFAPLYQDQGSFPGAHYVTADEEANGAMPFHGFNFRLVLRSYDGFDTCNEDNSAGRDVYFVPPNLIEMLYCFVFSQEYGVNGYFKYPVTYLDRFNTLSEQLFKAFRIAVRNGVVGNWTDSIDPKIASISNATLHRI